MSEQQQTWNSIVSAIKGMAAQVAEIGNKNVDTLAKQLILLDSGALGVLSLNPATNLILVEKILLTVATVLFGTSLLSVVILYMQVTVMARKAAKKFNELEEIIAEQDEAVGAAVLQKSIGQMKLRAGIVAYWISVLTFLVAAILVAVLVMFRIW